MSSAAIASLCLLGWVLISNGGGDATPSIAKSQWKDIDGIQHQLNKEETRKGMVVVFISETCPIANSYQPELERIRKDYAPLGYDFIMVHSDPDLTVEKAREHVKQFGIRCGVVLDPQQATAKLLGAKATPEAFLLSEKGEVLYRGRIDDRYLGIGKKKVAAERQDLREALTEHSQGKSVSVPSTPAVGCLIRIRSESP